MDMKERLLKYNRDNQEFNEILVAINSVGKEASIEQISAILSRNRNFVVADCDKLESHGVIYQKFGYTNYGQTSFYGLTTKGSIRLNNYLTVRRKIRNEAR